MDNPNIDKVILYFLRKFFNSKSKIKEEKLEEKEEELTGKEREYKHRMMIYEIYKVINPRQLAGERPIDNFINNVLNVGIKKAIIYEGGHLARFFDKNELKNLESHGASFSNIVKEQGFKGGGKGLK